MYLDIEELIILLDNIVASSPINHISGRQDNSLANPVGTKFQQKFEYAFLNEHDEMIRVKSKQPATATRPLIPWALKLASGFLAGFKVNAVNMKDDVLAAQYSDIEDTSRLRLL